MLRPGQIASRRRAGIALIVALALVVLVAVVRPNPFADEQTIWAKFDNVNGLGSIDRDIRVAGVNEGEIGTVKRVGDDVLVELEVSPEISVHEDAEVALRPHTLFEGSAFIDLHPGSPSAPPIAEDAVIPRERTRVYVSLDEALRVLREPVRESLRGLARVGAEATGGDAPRSLQRTLRRSPQLTEELGPVARALRGPEGTELAGAIRGSAATVEALAAREASLAALAGRTERTLRALDVDGTAALDRALAALPQPLETLSERGARLTALVDRIDRLSVELAPALVEAAPALRELQPIIARATPAIRRAVPLVSAIGTVLRRAATAAPTLERLLETLAPGQRILDERVMPTLARESRLGVPTYLQMLSGFSGGTAALRPYQTEAQGTLGDGHMIRLGAYFDPAGTLGLEGALPCDLIAQLDQALATALEAGGFCKS